MRIKCFLHASWGFALCAVFAALAAVAVDLPWVYDSSERTVVDVKSAGSANHSTEFASMAGHWSYPSNTSRLRTDAWHGVMLIIR